MHAFFSLAIEYPLSLNSGKLLLRIGDRIDFEEGEYGCALFIVQAANGVAAVHRYLHLGQS
jgi:hypothetical protein